MRKNRKCHYEKDKKSKKRREFFGRRIRRIKVEDMWERQVLKRIRVYSRKRR